MRKAPDSSIFSGIELDLEDGHALGRKVHFRPYINRYNAQQKLFRHAYAKLPKEFSGLKFANKKGRDCVTQTSEEDFITAVGNPTNLRTNNIRNGPVLKQGFDSSLYFFPKPFRIWRLRIWKNRHNKHALASLPGK